METYGIYSGGRFMTATQELKVTNKYSGETFASTYLADEKIFDETVTAAVKAKSACRELSSHEKYIALKYISEALSKNKERLGKVLSAESGKPMKYAVGEIERSAQ